LSVVVTSRAGRAVLVAVGILGSAALAGLAFFRVELGGGLHLAPRFDLGEWVRTLPSHLGWVIPFMVLAATLSPLRALVWGETLPEGHHPHWRARFHALAFGALVQNGLPGHLGVLASGWSLRQTDGVPVAAGLASLLVAKLLEFGALVATTCLLAAIAGVRGVGGVVSRPMLLAGLAALLVFVVALAGARRLAPRLAHRLAQAGRFPRLAAALDAVGVGLVAVGSARRLLRGGALAFAPVLASATGFALALRHVGGSSFLLGGGLLVGAVTLTQMVPGLPSSIGLYYFVCTAAARALGVPDEQAAALAALSHAASGATHILVGLVATLAQPGGLRQLLGVRQALRGGATTSPRS
jgi:hypothetical protein